MGACALALSVDVELQTLVDVAKSARTPQQVLREIQAALQNLDRMHGPIKNPKAHAAMKYHLLRAAAHVMDQMARSANARKSFYKVEDSFDLAQVKGLYKEFPVAASAEGFHMTLEIEGASDGMIGFFTDKVEKAANAYEVRIGGFSNSHSSIRMATAANGGGKELTADFKPNRLAAGIKKKFWISFDGKVMQVGDKKGMFMAAVLPSLKVGRIVIGVTAWDVPVSFTMIQIRDFNKRIMEEEDFGDCDGFSCVPRPPKAFPFPPVAPVRPFRPVVKGKSFGNFGTNHSDVHILWNVAPSKGFLVSFKGQASAGIHFGVHDNLPRRFMKEHMRWKDLQALHSGNAYATSIGVEGGRSIFRRNTFHPEAKVVASHLHGDSTHVDMETMQFYWAQLSPNGMFYVGTGALGQNAFIGTKVKRMNAAKLSLAFSGGLQKGAFADVRLYDTLVAEPALIVPPNRGMYTLFDAQVRTKGFRIEFAAQAAADIFLAFMVPPKAPTSDRAYEVVLGGSDGRTVIRKGTQTAGGIELASVRVPNVCSDDKFTSYWARLRRVRANSKEALGSKFNPDVAPAKKTKKGAKKPEMVYLLSVGKGEFNTNTIISAVVPLLNQGKGQLAVGFAGYDDVVKVKKVKTDIEDDADEDEDDRIIKVHDAAGAVPGTVRSGAVPGAEQNEPQCPFTDDHRACMRWNLWKAAAKEFRRLAEKSRRSYKGSEPFSPNQYGFNKFNPKYPDQHPVDLV